MNAQTATGDSGPLVAFLLFWAVTCIDPPHPHELVLQHIPTTIAVAALAIGRRRLPLSNSSVRLVLMFLSLHVLGARYLYSYVPYDDWSAALFGRTASSVFGFTRNHYDRLVHVAYGVLLFFPAREVVVGRLQVRGLSADVLALQLILATSALYELIEWGVALVFAPDWSEHYNGQQGDLWDAQKDMALAMLGAVATKLIRSPDAKLRG